MAEVATRVRPHRMNLISQEPQPQSIVPYGFCHCHCGRMTRKAKQTNHALGHVKGMHVRFIPGHALRIRPVIEEAVSFKIDGVYCRFIRLQGGLITIVDESDYVPLMHWKWFAKKASGSNGFYVFRNTEGGYGGPVTLMHREILRLSNDEASHIDHRDGCHLNNTRNNLRAATAIQSAQNRGIPKNNSSGFKGVTFQPLSGSWRARIGVNGKRLNLGDFRTKQLAASAYRKAAQMYHGDFSRMENYDKNL